MAGDKSRLPWAAPWAGALGQGRTACPLHSCHLSSCRSFWLVDGPAPRQAGPVPQQLRDQDLSGTDWHAGEGAPGRTGGDIGALLLIYRSHCFSKAWSHSGTFPRMLKGWVRESVVTPSIILQDGPFMGAQEGKTTPR